MSDPESPPQVAALTLRNSAGERYARLETVEAQLAALVPLSPLAVAERARAVQNFRHPDYVVDESLAYFLREWHRTGVEEGFGELLAEMLRRVERRARAAFRSYPELAQEEATERVIERLYVQMFTLSHSRGEYWQVRFGNALNRAINDVRDQAYKRSQQEWATLRDTSSDTGDDGYDPLEREATDAETMEAQYVASETTREALAAITDARHREAFNLRHIEGWPIEGEGPHTISIYFNVTSRTIRNWLATAHEQLRRWQEAQ